MYPKTCTEMTVPDDKLAKAKEIAAREQQGAPRRAGGWEIAAESRKLWAPGRTLKVSFIGGETAIRDKVATIARQWERHASVRLDFGDHGDADIRVAFNPGGSWSYIGTDAGAIEGETMNFGWLAPDTADEEYDRVVLHEFGHALGCIHEHQHPQAGIPWNKEAVYKHYKETNGWSPQQVDVNIFQRYSSTSTNFSQYDPASIMHYPVPAELTDGGFIVGWNTALSAEDKKYMRIFYPAAAAAGGLESAGAPSARASALRAAPPAIDPARLRMLHVCTECVLPADKVMLARQIAAETQRRARRPQGGVEIAAEAKKLWEPGRTLTIRFLSGAPDIQEKVQHFAREWEQHANISFDFGNHADADIRIDIVPGGSSSYVGTDSRAVAGASMKFGWLKPDTTDQEYRRVVLHEFGHALGCIHEHQHPESAIAWNRQAAYDYYRETNGWKEADVDRFVFERYSATTTNFSAYDPQSIMHYPVPPELTDGAYEVGWNNDLSGKDRQFMKTYYPR